MQRLFLSLFLILGLGQPALAAKELAPEAAAKALIEGMATEAIEVLADKNRTPALIQTKFNALLSKGFDLNYIGRFVLARYWRNTTPAQQADYLKLFQDYIVGIYANRFAAYSGETLVVGDAKIDGDDVIVASRINRTNGAPPVAVDWRVQKSEDGQYRVIDVIIEQVSMGITQRSEFSSIIQNGGGRVEALLAQLRAKTGN